MQTRRTLSFMLLAAVCLLTSLPNATARPANRPLLNVTSTGVLHASRNDKADAGSARKSESGLREIISDKYKERYQEWKDEFLATDFGRQQWESFEQDSHFTLTITISGGDRFGAGTGKYKWDDEGKLIGATITLGSRLNEGYPNPIYYPVMNALRPRDPSTFALNGNILAATKIAHEFGHVKQAMTINAETYRLQNQLIPVYNEILLSNGRNVKDPRLVDIATQIGGTPVKIWEDREYWGEANAIQFLRERITNVNEFRILSNRINQSVELYARDYSDRFEKFLK
jgi:hypothetical protein